MVQQAKDLETENNKLLDVINNQDVKIADLEEENAELKEQHRVDLIQTQATLNQRSLQSTKLTKAKELLERCYENYIYLEPLRSEIEQFLKEIEK